LFAQIPVRKDRPDVGLIRRLVGAEARIAIDPVDSFLRIGDVIRRKTQQFRIDRFHQLHHPVLQLRVENLFARLEPFTAIISLQTAEKR